MLPTLSNSDLGHPSIPGTYAFNESIVTVDRFHIAAWSATPDVAFNTILCTKAGDTVIRLALGQTASDTSV